MDIWTSTSDCFRVFRVGGYQFPGVSLPFLWMLHQFNFDHFGFTSGSSMAKVMICSLIVWGCSTCEGEITLQGLLSPKYAEDLPPQMDFSGYVRDWIVLWKNCVSEFVHFCFGEFCLSVIFLYAYLPKQPTNIGHISYCQVHFWVVSTKKTLHHNHCRPCIYLHNIYFFITNQQSSWKSASLPSFPSLGSLGPHRAIITLRIWWLPSMWPPAPKEGTNHESYGDVRYRRWVMNLRISRMFGNRRMK